MSELDKLVNEGVGMFKSGCGGCGYATIHCTCKKGDDKRVRSVTYGELEAENAELRANLVKIFERIRQIRDKEKYVGGLIGLESYIHVLLNGGGELEQSKEQGEQRG